MSDLAMCLMAAAVTVAAESDGSEPIRVKVWSLANRWHGDILRANGYEPPAGTPDTDFDTWGA